MNAASRQHQASDIDLAYDLCAVAMHTPADHLFGSLDAVIARMSPEADVHLRADPPGGQSFAYAVCHEQACHGYLVVDRAGAQGIEALQPFLESLARLVGWLLHQRGRLDRQLEDSHRAIDRLTAQSQILDQIHESVITMDLGGFITGWNKGAEQLFGYSPDEAVGKHILFLYADPDSEDDSEGFQDVLLEHGGRELEVRRRRKSGEVFWASLQLSLMRNDKGEPTGLIGYLSDITARVEAEKHLRLQSRIFEHSEESILITDASRKILSVNPAFCQMTGYGEEEVIGKTPQFMRSDKHPESFYSALWERVDKEGSWHGEVWTKRRGGDDFPSWASISLVRNRDGEISHYFSIFTDITERKQAEERIHHMAYYDELTGLPNRSLFYKLVDHALAEAKRGCKHAAVLFIDLNRFKPINDSLGHAVGDHVLRQIGDRLRLAIRGEDVVARLGGDEFVVALTDIAQREHAAVVAQKILAALDPAFHVEEHELKVGAAIGISIYPRDGLDTESLMRMADIAMYRAKKSGQDGYAFYSHEMNQRALDRLKLETALRHGIEHGELLLYYQPKVDIDSGWIVGAEALVRWRHPERGMVPPGDFIPVAEESGLIVRISAWVLEAVMRQARQWYVGGLKPVKIAANLSARDFSADLAERVASLLSSHGLPPEWLELEITEGMLTHSSDEVIAMMDALTALGVSLALDDFGTGYSSLAYLKRFPIDTLKIDQSFVRGIPQDGNDCAIAGAIVGMAQRLGHRVIAEGVETAEQLEFLHSLGCQEIQGYLFSPPVPAEKFEAMLREGKTLRAC